MRIPAMANVHSHAFQRDLRGVGERSDRADDDFWSWREGMYALAGRLDPSDVPPRYEGVARLRAAAAAPPAAAARRGSGCSRSATRRSRGRR